MTDRRGRRQRKRQSMEDEHGFALGFEGVEPEPALSCRAHSTALRACPEELEGINSVETSGLRRNVLLVRSQILAPAGPTLHLSYRFRLHRRDRCPDLFLPSVRHV